MGNLTASEWKRFMSRVRIDEVGGCHTWTGPLDRHGYGSFHLRRKGRRAHRVAWYNAHGEIGDDMYINHVCRNRACVNVQHLTKVTPLENVHLDSVSPPAINARKTQCPRGHAYDRQYKSKNGVQRYCSICEREKKKRLTAKWRAEDTLRV